MILIIKRLFQSSEYNCREDGPDTCPTASFRPGYRDDFQFAISYRLSRLTGKI
jgi:hypothetical protein